MSPHFPYKPPFTRGDSGERREHADDMKTLIETLVGIEDSSKSVTGKTDPRLREAS
jgi:hypothetical protein